MKAVRRLQYLNFSSLLFEVNLAKKWFPTTLFRLIMAYAKLSARMSFANHCEMETLMVKCNNVSQIKTLVNLTEIFDAAGNKISIITSVMALPGA